MEQGIDFIKIGEFLAGSKSKKPPYLNVDDSQWHEALDGCASTYFSALTTEEMESTQNLWKLIYFSAVYFCKGFEHSRVKQGLQEQTNYPTY